MIRYKPHTYTYTIAAKIDWYGRNRRKSVYLYPVPNGFDCELNIIMGFFFVSFFFLLLIAREFVKKDKYINKHLRVQQ
jgi:hypothetical protein